MENDYWIGMTKNTKERVRGEPFFYVLASTNCYSKDINVRSKQQTDEKNSDMRNDEQVCTLLPPCSLSEVKLPCRYN